MTRLPTIATALFLAAVPLAPALAQSHGAPQVATAAGTAAAPGASAPRALVLYFDSGSATVRPADTALLDQAARLYRDGKPLVMIVTGTADLVGNPELNLTLSQARADAVEHGLVARGIPAGRFQVLAKGETDPSVPTPPGVAEARNRRVEITWR
jgi:OOP family OmpA-OmpF porin